MIFYLLTLKHTEKPLKKGPTYEITSKLSFSPNKLTLIQETSGKPPLPGFSLSCDAITCKLTQGKTTKKVDASMNYFKILTDMVFNKKIPFNLDLIPGQPLRLPLKEQGLKELYLECTDPFNPKTWTKLSIYNIKNELERVYSISH